MAFISREDFIKMQQEKQNYSAEQKQRVSYFSLKDDGDEACVRFAYTNPDQFDILTTHQITDPETGRFRRVNCIRGLKESVDKCPLCNAGTPMQQKFYIKLVEYVRNEDGTITATPRIWERPTSYVNILNNLFAEYGDISDCVFKVKRSGEKGSMQTTYNILYANQQIYNANVYKKDFSAFDGYKVLGGPVMDKTYEELQELVGTPTKEPTPTYTEQAQPRKVVY